jgi:hypothetical protein
VSRIPTFEVICTHCDGLGEQRERLLSLEEITAMGSAQVMAYQARNVAGWDLRYDLGYMRRRCEPCVGEGFRPAGPSVPTVGLQIGARFRT